MSSEAIYSSIGSDLPQNLPSQLELSKITPARLNLSPVGQSLSTKTLLDLQLAASSAKDAIWKEVDRDALAADLGRLGVPSLQLDSKISSRDSYLRLPLLGRRLGGKSLSELKRDGKECDLVIALVDGLSSSAIHNHGIRQIEDLITTIQTSLGELAISPIALVKGGRVAIGDEIGEVLRAKAVVVLIGERPGLSVSDSLGAYVTLSPKVGKTDADRSCISNIHQGGTSTMEASLLIVETLKDSLALDANSKELLPPPS